ncbi:uncharacterized protein [Montipora foliosa]|uniref:uncharacterized protein n=1 Tax=Montipora foliosa TaxID=591990 RepID=UPI0035F1DA9D
MGVTKITVNTQVESSKCEWGAAVIPSLYDFSISMITLDCHNRFNVDIPFCKRHEVTQHGIVWEQYEAEKERDIMGFYHCRMSCGLVFSTKSTRNKHESTAHSGTTVQTEQDQQDGSGKEAAKEDFLFNYHQAKLTFGLILFEFDDAIKEGDSDRLHDFYRFGLLLFKAYGKTKYAYVILLYLAKIKAILSESDAHDLKWNRTFNKHGLPGMNIPLDLPTEQYNRDVKGMWDALGANINEDSAARVANTVEPMENIYDSIRIDFTFINI